MTTNFLVGPGGFLMGGEIRIGRCAIGAGGMVPASDKREGDRATPLGIWPLRGVLYRPDREAPPLTRLCVAPLGQEDGWCDGAGPLYNRAVSLPSVYSHERMWRDDHCYDLVIVIGHNDDPVAAGRGSAIFVHLAREGYTATEGCVALTREDMLRVLLMATPGSVIEIIHD